jgi:hypothetical protein
MDSWKIEWVEFCEKIGNRISNNYYEGCIPEHMSKPTPITIGGTSGDTIEAAAASRLEKWLRNKYELRLFVSPGSIDPVDLVKQGHNPMKGESPIRKKKKKKSIEENSPISQQPVQETPRVILPPDWQSNIFLKSWAIANGVI